MNTTPAQRHRRSRRPMNAPARIAHIVDAMLNPCPYCKARPLTPCQSEGHAPLRYTHAERNR